MIVGSDADTHHIIWSSSDINLRSSSLMKCLSSSNLGLLMVGTFMVSAREEVLDIMLRSNRFTSHQLTNWHVSDDYLIIATSQYEHMNVNLQTLHLLYSTNWELANTMDSLRPLEILMIGTQLSLLRVISQLLVTLLIGNVPHNSLRRTSGRLAICKGICQIVELLLKLLLWPTQGLNLLSHVELNLRN